MSGRLRPLGTRGEEGDQGEQGTDAATGSGHGAGTGGRLRAGAATHVALRVVGDGEHLGLVSDIDDTVM
ncbi:MAG: hypothetical protein L0K84_09210, partial [Acidipropionibacterium jensenii]|nr:hypothetical protein [Acidipropionibacterium jensenii]